MTTSGRSWVGFKDSRPARDVDIRYGSGLVLEESAGWPRYLAIATRTPWRIVQPYLAVQPAAAGIVRFQDWDHLEEVSRSLPNDAELVVGIGGGTSLDASEYVALRKGLPLVLVPTVVSTGAIIHGVFPKWKGRHFVPPASEWPFCDAEHVLVDYDLVLEAPEHLNTAGLGDVLCGFAGIAEWRTQARLGKAPGYWGPTSLSAISSKEPCPRPGRLRPTASDSSCRRFRNVTTKGCRARTLRTLSTFLR